MAGVNMMNENASQIKIIANVFLDGWVKREMVLARNGWTFKFARGAE